MSKNFDNRQPEIDALKEKIAGGSPREVITLKTELQLMVEQRETLWKEIDALKAENERVHQDAAQFAVLLKAFMFSEVQSHEELDAGKTLIQKYAAMKAPSMRVLPDTKGEWE